MFEKWNSGKKYKKAVINYYLFLSEEFNYTRDDKSLIIGWTDGYYDIKFKKIDKVISIYHEPREDFYNIHFTDFLKKGHPEIDSITNSSGLHTFIKSIFPFLSESDFIQNNTYFDKFEAKNEMEKSLLDQAKELRLCLLNLDKIEV